MQLLTDNSRPAMPTLESPPREIHQTIFKLTFQDAIIDDHNFNHNIEVHQKLTLKRLTRRTSPKIPTPHLEARAYFTG
jgi:hypothetical protein